MILLTLLAAAALQAPQATAYPNETSPQTAETVEILRRLIAESLDRAFERTDAKKGESLTFRPEGITTNSFVTTLWAGHGTVQHSRAFHVPDAGVFLALDASLPLVEREAPPQDDAPVTAGDDEWERIRRELRGGGSVGPDGTLYRLRVAGPRKDFEIDPRAIDKAVDTVLETLARHGSRIEGLGQHDAVTVAFRITGKSRAWMHDFEEPGSTTDLFETNGTTVRSNSISAYVLSTANADVKPQHLVIRVAAADLAGQPTVERLRQRARINRY